MLHSEWSIWIFGLIGIALLFPVLGRVFDLTLPWWAYLTSLLVIFLSGQPMKHSRSGRSFLIFDAGLVLVGLVQELAEPRVIPWVFHRARTLNRRESESPADVARQPIIEDADVRETLEAQRIALRSRRPPRTRQSP